MKMINQYLTNHANNLQAQLNEQEDIIKQILESEGLTVKSAEKIENICKEFIRHSELVKVWWKTQTEVDTQANCKNHMYVWVPDGITANGSYDRCVVCGHIINSEDVR